MDRVCTGQLREAKINSRMVQHGEPESGLSPWLQIKVICGYLQLGPNLMLL